MKSIIYALALTLAAFASRAEAGTDDAPKSFRCPAGTSAVDDLGRSFSGQTCQRPDETRHGSFWVRSVVGYEVRGEYRDNKLHGPWTMASESGVITSGHYDQGRPDGTWSWRNAGGSAFATSVMNEGSGLWSERNHEGTLRRRGWLKNGQRIGLWVGYGSGGIDEVEHYRRGERHGLRRTYHENGALASLQTYRAGLEVGPYRRWFDDGEIAERGLFVDGRRHGMWRQWHADGRLQSEHRYERDSVVPGDRS